MSRQSSAPRQPGGSSARSSPRSARESRRSEAISRRLRGALEGIDTALYYTQPPLGQEVGEPYVKPEVKHWDELGETELEWWESAAKSPLWSRAYRSAWAELDPESAHSRICFFAAWLGALSNCSLNSPAFPKNDLILQGSTLRSSPLRRIQRVTYSNRHRLGWVLFRSEKLSNVS